MSDSGDEHLLKLFPNAGEAAPLRGLYTSEPLRPAGGPGRTFVYANFIVSLDGRISLPDPETKTHVVPRATANPRDWRLVQELAAGADVLVTTGRYIRDLAQGVAQDSLPVSDKPAFADLLEWRRARGLPPQPAVVVVSASLNLPIPDALLESGRKVYVATGSEADPERIAALQSKGVKVLSTGPEMRVDGPWLVGALDAEGFRNIDMVAGSELLNTLIAGQVLDRLYLTHACRVLGGVSFHTLLTGRILEPPASFELKSLYYDAPRSGEMAQLFAVYDYKRVR
ncbi:MAG TPA: dihydrofolate reductase family protein [Gammaproteobacteria bacterium]|nr:dihydrofolate reductase family protein [Gammaproteobacteria bacterium]